MRRPLARAGAACLVAAVGMVLSYAGVAGARSPGRLCHQACRERGMRASCAWLASNPRRCLGAAMRACRDTVRRGGPVGCDAPADLPACLTNHGCPFGSLCIDASCQVVACTGEADCGGDTACREGRCVVDDCRSSDQNCPLGFACDPAADPFAAVSGACRSTDPNATPCLANANCAGTPNRRCRRGVCAARVSRQRCADGSCFEACKRGRSAVRFPHCDASGRCVCSACESDPQCAARFSCSDGTEPACRRSGACVCGPTQGGGGTRGVCTSFETPPCTPCRVDGDCVGIDRCLQSATCG